MNKTIDDLGTELCDCDGLVKLIIAHIVGCTHPESEFLILSGLNVLSHRLMDIAEYYDAETLTQIIAQKGSGTKID
jgi:hypothetical protein